MYMRANFEESPVYAEHQGQGAHQQKSMARGLPQSPKPQIRGDRHHRGIGRGRGLVLKPVLALFYLQTVSKGDTLTSSLIVGLGLIIGTPTLILFGWLSDIIGRKPVILGGILSAAVTYYPLYAVARVGHAAGPYQHPDCGFDRRHSGRLCRDGLRADRRVPRRVFPSRIRYTSVSMPYMIGNGWVWRVGAFITTAAYTATGSLAYALIYPIAVPAVCLVLSLFLMPETRK